MTAFEFLGETFTYAETVDEFAVVEFAEAMDEGADAAGLHGLAVSWRLALGCVAEEDQQRFRVLCRKNKAGAELYLKVFRDRMELEADHPTQRSSDSSTGPNSTAPSSVTPPVAVVTSLPAAEERIPARTVLAARRSGLISA